MKFPWLLVLLVAGSAGRAAAGTEVCDDFLAQIHRPGELEMVSCQERPDLQSNPWLAEYRVKGLYAAQVEGDLARKLKMKRMRRVCCTWDSGENTFHDRRGRTFTITMASGETLVGSRKRWADIPYFYIEVRWYREDP